MSIIFMMKISLHSIASRKKLALVIAQVVLRGWSVASPEHLRIFLT